RYPLAGKGARNKHWSVELPSGQFYLPVLAADDSYIYVGRGGSDATHLVRIAKTAPKIDPNWQPLSSSGVGPAQLRVGGGVLYVLGDDIRAIPLGSINPTGVALWVDQIDT